MVTAGAIDNKEATGHADIKTMMIYVSLWKNHIRGQVERKLAEQLLHPFPHAYAIFSSSFPTASQRRLENMEAG